METEQITATAPEQVPAVQTPPEAAPAAAAPEDPIMAAVNSLGSKLDEALAGREQQAAAPVDDPMDFLDALEGDPDEPTATVPEQQPQGQLDPEAQRQVEEFEQFVDARARGIAEQMITPIVQEQRENAIRGLFQKYPDMASPEVKGPLVAQMQNIARRSGNDGVLSDPDMIEMAYMAVKAKLANAAEVPAETVGDNGASLETNAGQSQAGGSTDARQEYIDAMLAGSTGGSLISRRG